MTGTQELSAEDILKAQVAAASELPEVKEAAPIIASIWQAYSVVKQILANKITDQKVLQQVLNNLMTTFTNQGKMLAFDPDKLVRDIRFQLTDYLGNHIGELKKHNSELLTKQNEKLTKFKSELLPIPETWNYKPQHGITALNFIVAKTGEELTAKISEFAANMKSSGTVAIGASGPGDLERSKDVVWIPYPQSSHFLRSKTLTARIRAIVGSAEIFIVENLADAVTNKADQKVEADRALRGLNELRRWAKDLNIFVVVGIVGDPSILEEYMKKYPCNKVEF